MKCIQDKFVENHNKAKGFYDAIIKIANSGEFRAYNACPMCEGAIIDLRNIGYVDDIIYGIEKEYDAAFKANYDMLAEDISNGIMGIDY